MIKIHILHSTHFTTNENSFLAPLRRSKKILKREDVCLKFFNQIEDNLFEADILFISSKFFTPW